MSDLLVFSVLTHSGCGLSAAGIPGTFVRAIYSFALCREVLSAFFADRQRLRLEYGLQLRCCRQQRIAKASAQAEKAMQYFLETAETQMRQKKKKVA